jgi:hypothetical protein
MPFQKGNQLAKEHTNQRRDSTVELVTQLNELTKNFDVRAIQRARMPRSAKVPQRSSPRAEAGLLEQRQPNRIRGRIMSRHNASAVGNGGGMSGLHDLEGV